MIVTLENEGESACSISEEEAKSARAPQPETRCCKFRLFPRPSPRPARISSGTENGILIFRIHAAVHTRGRENRRRNTYETHKHRARSTDNSVPSAPLPVFLLAAPAVYIISSPFSPAPPSRFSRFHFASCCSLPANIQNNGHPYCRQGKLTRVI